MPQVPYSPVPDVAAEPGRVQGISIQTPKDAFGGGIAKALEGFGGDLRKAGDELYNRAIAIQDLKNAAETDEAFVNYSKATADLHANYHAKEGKNAVDSQAEYNAQLEETRIKIREGLSNDEVRRQYDKETKRTLGYNIGRGAEHAARQMKVYTNSALEGKIDASNQKAYDSQGDPQAFNDAVEQVEIDTRIKAAGKGLSEEAINEQVRENTSKARLFQIEGLARHQPISAKKLYDVYRANGLLTPEHGKAAENVVERYINLTGTRNAVAEVNADLTKDPLSTEKSLEQRWKEGDKWVDKVDPQNATLRKMVRDGITADVNQKKGAKKEFDQEQAEIIKEAIMRTNAKTVDQLRMDPKAAQAYDNLPVHEQKELQGALNRYHSAKNKPVNDSEMERVRGLRQTDKMGFLDLDITKLPLSQSQMNTVQAWQRQDRKDPKENPKVSQAVQWIRETRGAELQALDVYNRRKGVNEDRFDRFQGSVAVAIDVWHDIHGKYPTQKQVIEEIAPSLIQRTMEPGWLWGQNVKEEALVLRPVPKAFADDFRAHVRKTKGRELQEFEIERAYVRYQLLQLEEKKKKEQAGQ